MELARLANGLRVVVEEMPHTRSATVSVYVGAGSRYERDDQAGLSHFLEHMLFKGASRRPTAKQISEAIESVGGLHNAATDREVTVYYAKVPHHAAPQAIDILADMVCAPVMDARELEKERHVILEELASIEDSPGELAGILVDETLWPHQPLGRNVGGTPESVRGLGRDEVVDYFRRQYVPSNIVLSVAGNVRTGEVFELAARWLDGLGEADPGPWYPVQPETSGPRVAIRNKQTEQAHVCIAYPTVSLDHPDRFAVDLLSTLLGEGMSSRLFLDLREERALVYDVHSYPSEYRDAGAFTVYAGCDPEAALDTAGAILEQVDRVAAEGVPGDELDKARAMARGRLQLRMEDTRSVAGWWGSQLLLVAQPLTVDEAVGRLEALTADDLVRVADNLLARGRARMAVVGPFDDPSPITALL